MALEILDDVYYVRHALCHDLESIFYVLVWLCHTQSGPNGAIRSFNYTGSEIYRWNACEGDRSSPRSISETKAYVLKDNDGRKFQARILDPIDPYFDPIKPTIRELRVILFAPNVGEVYKSAYHALPNKPSDRESLLEVSAAPSERASKELAAQFVEILEFGLKRLRQPPPPPADPPATPPADPPTAPPVARPVASAIVQYNPEPVTQSVSSSKSIQAGKSPAPKRIEPKRLIGVLKSVVDNGDGENSYDDKAGVTDDEYYDEGDGDDKGDGDQVNRREVADEVFNVGNTKTRLENNDMNATVDGISGGESTQGFELKSVPNLNDSSTTDSDDDVPLAVRARQRVARGDVNARK